MRVTEGSSDILSLLTTYYFEVLLTLGSDWSLTASDR